MNIIVFGGSGFLGSWIVKKLLFQGYKVTVFDLKLRKSLLNKILGSDISKVNFIEGDITNYSEVFDATFGNEHVINLAGLMTPDCSSNPSLGAEVNVKGSINVFEAIKKNNIKLGFATSTTA